MLPVQRSQMSREYLKPSRRSTVRATCGGVEVRKYGVFVLCEGRFASECVVHGFII